ncbi:DUF5682 family protein [Novosphingobium sp. 1949]|uniref:DUF5682 family protein n=1 Tax=Novosphingobium organovorum TaxID=2930092 RepID=A0ABT0BIQ1_9SPHN|nr:DUF5682 family protein [Novosphingobium organovorum]MCJ2184696.1 DUF5682 family protein [Novosphingobium organovorum]
MEAAAPGEGQIHDRARDLWVVPIRHHSPACAAQLERLIAAVAPAAILVEGPCDFDPLIEAIGDPRTRAPFAVVALRETPGRQDAPAPAIRRVASYFPFCAHSPELVALHAARDRGIPARFIDLPSHARAMDADAALTEGRSLLGSEHPFTIGDYVRALARALGCRDGNEVWDHLFESRIAHPDWRAFFADTARYCAHIRAASDPASGEDDGTFAREAQMRALLAQTRAEIDGPILAVVGGFHAPALLAPPARADPPARTGAKTASRAYLVRYGMRQLDALRGYDAGLPLPGYYERLWATRTGPKNGKGRDDDTSPAALARTILTGFAAHLREAGAQGPAPEVPSVAVLVNAIEQAERLAALRGRPFALRDDILDAVRSTFVKGELARAGSPLMTEFHAWLTGTAIGDVPPSAASPPLVEAVRERARALGFTLSDGEHRTRHLDIYRKPRHRAASRLCHAMTLIGAPFAERTAGPDFRSDVALDRLHEVWRTSWSPHVEARLIALSEVADDLDEALAFVLAQSIAALPQAGRGRDARAAIELFAAACRAGLDTAPGGGTEALLALIEDAVIEDPEPASLVAALSDLLLLRRAGEALGIANPTAIDRLVATAWRRVLTLLPTLADTGEDRLDDALRALADLRGVLELARTAHDRLDGGLEKGTLDHRDFDTALERLAARPLAPLLAGAIEAFALIDGRRAPTALAARLSGELAGGYADPAERLAFLRGLIAIARELLWNVPEVLAALEGIVTGTDEDAFRALLPHLRLALMPLDPREIDRLAQRIAERLGTGSGTLTRSHAIGEDELAANLTLDHALARLLAEEGLA